MNIYSLFKAFFVTKPMPLLSALAGLFLVSGTITAVMPKAVAAPDMLHEPLVAPFTVSMTGYNALPEQTDDNPHETASGAYSNPEVVAARSRDLAETLPFGTVIRIDGPAEARHSCGFDEASSLIGYRVIADTMHARMKNRVDILFPNDAKVSVGARLVNPARALGICEGVTIAVVGHIDISKPSNLPSSQAELRARIGAGAISLR